TFPRGDAAERAREPVAGAVLGHRRGRPAGAFRREANPEGALLRRLHAEEAGVVHDRLADPSLAKGEARAGEPGGPGLQDRRDSERAPGLLVGRREEDDFAVSLLPAL